MNSLSRNSIHNDVFSTYLGRLNYDTPPQQRLTHLIRKNDPLTLLTYSEKLLPEASIRAHLYMLHLHDHSEAVQIMLFRDEVGAQLAWALAEPFERFRIPLQALLPGAGWRVDDSGNLLVRTETYQQELKTLSLPPQPITKRSNGGAPDYTFSEISRGPNGGTMNEMPSFVSGSFLLDLFQRVDSRLKERSGENSPGNSSHPSNRLVINQTICSKKVPPGTKDTPTRLVLLSAGERNPERDIHPSNDPNNSQFPLQGLRQAQRANNVVIHQNPQHALQVANAHENRRPNWCVRGCSFLASLFLRRV